VSKKW